MYVYMYILYVGIYIGGKSKKITQVRNEDIKF